MNKIDKLLNFHDDIDGFSEKKMESLLAQSVTEHIELAPKNLIVDHKLHHNPYLSRYGADWEKEIVKGGMISLYMCVT